MSGLFAEVIGDIIGGFEEPFNKLDQPVWETKEALHDDQRRVIIPGFIEQSPKLTAARPPCGGRGAKPGGSRLKLGK